MDISNLVSRKITVLNEAEDSRYGIPDEEFDIENNQPQNNEDEQPNEQDDTNEPDDSIEQDDNEPDEGNEDDTENSDEDQYPDNSEEEPEEEPADEEPEEEDNTSSIPKLTILNLPEKDKKLNNLKILKQFNELSRNVSDNLNNNIINITTLNKKQRQVLDFVLDNLFKMIDDINNYVLYKFDDVYEENVLVYNTYQKRYRIALELVRQIIDEQNE